MSSVETSSVLRFAVFAAAVLSYCVSFTLPTLHLERGSYIAPLAVLLFGWGTAAWYANLTAGLAFILSLYGKVLAAVTAAIVTVALCLSTFAIVGNRVPTDEGGGTDRVTTLGAGAYFWMASMFLFVLYVLLLAWQRSKVPQSPVGR